MKITTLFKNKVKNAEHSQGLHQKRKSWLYVFMLLCTILISGTFVAFQDEILLAERDRSIDVVYSLSAAVPTSKDTAVVTIGNRGTKSTKVSGGSSYVFMSDTGYTMLLLSFQEKEVYTVDDSLELSIKDAYDPSTQLLSGYTITTAFSDLGYKDGTAWKSLGKIYAEYGTLGLTGVDAANKQTLISSIIDTDFADVDGLDTVSNVELLNGLAYRSNVITDELVSRSIIYVPRYAAVYDNALNMSVNAVNCDNILTKNFDLGSSPLAMTPWMSGLINKNMWIGLHEDYRIGTKSNSNYYGSAANDNYKALLKSIQTAFNPNKSYSEKRQAAEHLQRAIAYSWPVLTNKETENNTDKYGPMMSEGLNGLEVTYIDPSVSEQSSDKDANWRTPFIYDAYVIEDTLHTGSARNEDFIENTANKLDSDEDYLAKYKTDALDEEKLHKDLMLYYEENPDMAYAVLDCVFGNIVENCIAVGTATANNVDVLLKWGLLVPSAVAAVDYINFEGRLTAWFVAGIDNYPETDVNREDRIVGIRQAELNCALAHVIKLSHPTISDIDTFSNIEIRLINAYTNVGIMYTTAAVAGENSLTDEEKAEKASLYTDTVERVENEGWSAWDAMLGVPGSSYCTTHETIASNFYDYEKLAGNKHKVTTLAACALGYAQNNKFVLPTADDNSITVGGTYKQDIVIDAINMLGKVTYGRNSSKYLRFSAGVDDWYENSGINTSDMTKANLAPTSTLRQAYLCTIFSRGTAASGRQDMMYNYVGMFNIGFARETSSTNVGFTGLYSESFAATTTYFETGKFDFEGPWTFRKQLANMGLSKYQIVKDTKNTDASARFATMGLTFNNTTVNLLNSNMGNAHIDLRNKLVSHEGTMIKLVDYIVLSQEYTASANSFSIRSTVINNWFDIMAVPSGSNTLGFSLASVDSAYTDKFKLNNNYDGTRIGGFGGGLSLANMTNNNTFKVAFTTYNPSTDTISKLNEAEEYIITSAQNNTVAAYGYFAYLYNRTYYQKADKVEIHAVLGFRDKEATDYVVDHTCSPSDVSDKNMVLGVNLSRDTLNYLLDVIGTDSTKFAQIVLSLGGKDSGKLGYLNDNETSVLTSEFDTSLLLRNEKRLISSGDFGVLHLISHDTLSVDDELPNYVKAQKYTSWQNRTLADAAYIGQTLTTNTVHPNDADKLLVTLNAADIKKLLEDDKYNTDPTFQDSDTEFMILIAEWPAESLVGPDGERLSTVDTADKISTNKIYTLGVECQLTVGRTNEDKGVDELENIALLKTDTLTEDTKFYTNVGSGLYSGLYATSSLNGDLESDILALRDKKLMPAPVADVNEYLTRNVAYGEGTDNHVYFSFESDKLDTWQFKGTASLMWVNSENKKIATGTAGQSLGDTITSIMNVTYDGGTTTIKDFYDTLKSEDTEYIVVSIGESSEDKEGSFQPTDIMSTDAASQLSKLAGLVESNSATSALQRFNGGSIIYTLDQFIELLGGKESDSTTATFPLKDYFVNTSTSSLTAVEPGGATGSTSFTHTRLEYSFVLSVYAIGAYDDYKEAAEAETKALGNYINAVYEKVDVPLFDVTKGLAYVFSHVDDTDMAMNSTANARYASAMNRELANERAAAPDEDILETDTLLYQILKTTTSYPFIWQPDSVSYGSGISINAGVNALEGNGLRLKSIKYTSSLGDDLTPGKDAWVAMSTEVPSPEGGDTYILRTSSPISYTQVKNGSWTTGIKSEQEWNVLTGIPSTETFYITSGGSQFIVEMTMSDLVYEQAYRSYISYFASNNCKFKNGDIASAGGGSVTFVDKANISHELNNVSSVGTITDNFNLPEPTGYTSASYTVSAHGGNTITAYWTGTIANTTANPGITNHVAYTDNIAASGDYDLGHPGQMVESGQELEAGSYSWNVDPYNTALKQAQNWALLLEQASDGAGNVIITSNSDEKVRSWHVGDAVISISMDNVDNFPGINEKDVKAWHGKWQNGKTDTTDYTDWLLESNDARLTSGWAEKHGEHTVICEACKGGLTDTINGNCYNVTSKTGHWANYETDLANYNCASHTNTKNVNVAGKYNITCVAPSGTSTGSCSAVWEWTTITPVEYLVHWCGHDESTPLTDASGNSFTACTYKKVVDSEKVEDDPDTPENEYKAEEYHYEVDVAHKEVPATGAVTAVASHTCYSTHNWVDIDTTTVAAQPLTYHITVTFTGSYTNGDNNGTSTPDGYYPTHSCCGPCCSHVLPGIADEWVQWISYSTVRITDVRISKISRFYVEGQNDLTLDQKDGDYLLGSIEEGDVNIFYNIATENATYSNSYLNDRGGYTKDGDATYTSYPGTDGILVDGASLAGRIRYSVQAQQHDKVIWYEYNQLNQAKRTSECDGQDSTAIKNGSSIGALANYNPSPDGGEGHNEWWALGILYRRSNSSTDVYYRGTAEKEEEYNTKFTHQPKGGWLQGDGDGTFNGYVKNVTGDKSNYSDNTLDAKDKLTWEYNRFVARRTTVNNVAVMTDTLILQGTRDGDRTLLYDERISAGKTTEQDHKKGEDGLDMTLRKIFGENLKLKKYTYSGQGEDVEVPYHILETVSYPTSVAFGGYNGEGDDDELNHYVTMGGKTKNTKLDSDGSAYDATIKHTDDAANVPGAKAYATIETIDDSLNAEMFKSSAALMERRIARPTTSLRIGQLDIQIDPTMQNHLHETEKSTQSWFQILNYTEEQAEDLEAALDKEYYKANNKLSDYKAFEQESYYYGYTATGYLSPIHKVNDIVIHSPISSENNYILQDTDFIDQRNDSVNMSHDNTTKTCPGSAILCEYSYLDCKYLEEVTLFNLTFDEYYTRVDSNGEVSTGRAYAIDTYGCITSITDVVNYVVIPAKTGLITAIDTTEYGTGINVNGTELNIPLELIDAQYTTGTKIRLSIQGQFTVNTTVFECGDIKATMQSNGIKIMNGDKSAYVFYFNDPTAYHNYEFIIDYDGLDGFQLKVDNRNVAKSASSPAPDEINVQFNRETWSDTLSIGERCKLYNVTITHLPGTTKCTDGCYDNKYECPLVANYTCDIATKFTGTSLPHKYTAAISGTYLLELYDSAGNYQTEKVYLSKGESIYAYLGNKGYWSYSGTDRRYTTEESQTYTDLQIGTKNGTVLNPSVTVLSKTSGTGTVTLTPGVYFLEAGGDAGDATKGGRATGWLAVKETTTYYYNVGENAASSWISSSSTSTNSLVFGGNGSTNAVASTSYYKNVQSGTTAENVVDTGYVCIERYVDASSDPNLSDITFTASTTIINPMTTPQTVLSKTSGTGTVSLSPGIYYIKATGQAGSADKGGAASGWLLVKSTGTYYYNVNGTSWFNSSNTAVNALALAGKGGTAEIPAIQEITYSGSAKTITLAPSTYTIEAWGAQGGRNTRSDTGEAKTGGYVKGTFTIDTATSLFVVVGGKGGDETSRIDNDTGYNYNGGYNGGGSGSGSAGPGGGGATHIQIGTTGHVLASNGKGLSSTASNFKGRASSMTNLLLIAGGGGAGSATYSGIVSYANGDNGRIGWYNDSWQYDNGGGGAGYNGGISSSGDDTLFGASGTSWVDTTKLTNTTVTTGTLIGNGKVKITDVNGGSKAVAAVTSFTNNLTDSSVSANTSDAQSLTVTKYVDLTGVAAANIPDNLITQMLTDGTTGTSNTSETVVGEYSYTGGIQSVTLTPGEYKLEVWGAQGASGYDDTSTVYYGGKGGYSAGTYTTEATVDLYIAVGGPGISCGYGAGNAVFNGGGTCSNKGTDIRYGGSGGGATHIATMTGELSSLDSNQSAVLLVAGGGGAADGDYNRTYAGGYGGGTNSGSVGASIATQTTGYAFGVGQSVGTSPAGAGGGGWYGGYGGNCVYGGSGGSGYVNPILTDATTIANVNESLASTAAAGKAKITRLASYSTMQSVTINTVSNVVLTTLVETDITVNYTKYHYDADTSAIILSNAAGDPIVLEYTGAMQAVTLEPGTYRLEAWGASGGMYSSSYSGAEGGYTAGTVTFDKTTTLYVYVGQQGASYPSNYSTDKMFNGGGQGYDGGDGGGATDIRLVADLWYNTDSLKSRILVAGGGGGSALNSSGGAGGGITGGNALYSQTGSAATGATQTSGGTQPSNTDANGTFGTGGGNGSINDGGGGGGGYYGGASGTDRHCAGSGGSSYVSGYTGCDTTYLANQKVNGKNLTFSNVTIQQGGNVGNGRVKITKLDTTAKYQTMESDGYTWVKVFSHDTDGGFFTSEAEVLHTGTPTSDKYSILDELEKLKTSSEEKYVFKLVYPETGKSNIWKQTNTPQNEYVPDGNGTQKVTGYEAVNISMTGNHWGGLAKSTANSTFIDGSINSTNWFYAIGSYRAWPNNGTTQGDTIPGGDSKCITQVELWVATDIVKIEAFASEDALGDNIFNSTVMTTGSCPEESPYYWFYLAPKTNVAQIRLIHDSHTADCEREVNTLNSHTHTAECIGNTPAYDYLLYSATTNAPNLNELCLTYLGVSSASIGNVYTALVNKTIDLDTIPASVDGHDNPILNCYNHNTEHVHTAACKASNKTSICNNIHHQGDCYELGHPLCYSPCNDNETHMPTKITLDGTENYIGSAVNLNGYFQVYWDNIGDFYDTGDKGSLAPSSEKGQGYVNSMDTTRWLKQKVIIFNDIDVLFFNPSTGEWEQYLAGEEIYLPIVTDDIFGNGDDDEKRNWRDKDTTNGIMNLEDDNKENLRTITHYTFYCLLNNNEYDKTVFQAWTEALNSPSSEGQGNEPYLKERPREYDILSKETNFDRSGVGTTPETSYTALYCTKQYHLFDVVGNIGNMIITYTTDPRWSNFFKQADVEAGWQMENLLYEIVENDQERYLYIGREDGGTFKDIRNHEIKADTLFLDTWNNEAWKHTAVPINAVLESDLLAAQTNYTWSKLAEELKCGYDIYCEITTTGDYTDVDVEYKYYAFDTYTGDICEIDLWSKVDSNYLAYYLADDNAYNIQNIINQDSLAGYYGIESTESLALYHLYVDLSVEQGLRMVTDAQLNETNTLSVELDKYAVSEDMTMELEGETVTYPVAVEKPGEGLSMKRLDIGTAYSVFVNSRSRVLVGSSYDNLGLRQYNTTMTQFEYPMTIMDTNTENKISDFEFTTQARRWLFTAGLAENTVAVKYDGTTHVDLTTQSTNENIIDDYDRYAIFIGANIVAHGDIWNLEYEAFEASQNVLGKSLSADIPDIIAVYGLSSKEDDFDVEQSH